MPFLRRCLFTLAVFTTATAFVHASLDDLLNYVPQDEKAGEPVVEATVEHTHAEAVESLAPAAGTVTEQALLQDLGRLLEKHYELSGELKLTPLQRWKPLPVPGESWKTEITAYPSGGMESRFALRFRIHSTGRVIGEWTWMLRAELWQEAFVTRKQINARELLSITDFTMRPVDALRLRDALVPPTTNLANFSTRSTVAANKPLFWGDLEARTLVNRGEPVKVLAVNGALSITMNARALEDGALGDIVTVRNLQSNKRIQGEVTDENTVRIYF